MGSFSASYACRRMASRMLPSVSLSPLFFLTPISCARWECNVPPAWAILPWAPKQTARRKEPSETVRQRSSHKQKADYVVLLVVEWSKAYTCVRTATRLRCSSPGSSSISKATVSAKKGFPFQGFSSFCNATTCRVSAEQGILCLRPEKWGLGCGFKKTGFSPPPPLQMYDFPVGLVEPTSISQPDVRQRNRSSNQEKKSIYSDRPEWTSVGSISMTLCRKGTSPLISILKVLQ